MTETAVKQFEEVPRVATPMLSVNLDDGLIKSANPKFLKLMGISNVSEIVGKKHVSDLLPDYSPEELRNYLFQTARSAMYEMIDTYPENLKKIRRILI